MAYEKVIWIALMVFILAIPSTMAARQFCLDTETSVKQSTIDTNISGELRTYPFNVTETCDYGCDSTTGKCQPPPFVQTITLGIVFLFIVLLIIWFVRR